MKRLLIAAVLAATLAACASPGDTGYEDGDPRGQRDADAVGTVASVQAGTDSMLLGFAPDEGYEYFEGTTFDEYNARQWGITDAEGNHFDEWTFEVGDRIAVWVAACAESYPVQCNVEAIEVLDH